MMAKRSKRKILLHRRGVWIVLCIFALALAIRLIYLHGFSKGPTFLVPIVDSETYDSIARSFVSSGVMNERFFWQGFFYPFFLSIVYFLSGGSLLWARIIQIVLGSALCPLVYWIGRDLFDRRTGIVAGVVTALSGPLVFFESELLATGWASVWSVLLLFLVLKAAERKGYWIYLALGLCGGLSVITRATFLPFFVASSVWLAYALRGASVQWKSIVVREVLIAVGFLLITIPVAAVSYETSGDFNPLPHSGSINLYIGNNPETSKTIMIRPGAEWRELTRLPEVHGAVSDREHQQYFMRLFLHYVKAEPGHFLRGLVDKTVQFLSSRELPRNVDVYTARTYSKLFSILVWKRGGFGFPFGVLLAFAVLGLFVHRRRVTPPILLFLILYPLAVIIVFVTSRYRTPIVPITAVFASAGFWSFHESIRAKRWLSAALMACAVVAVMLLSSIAGPFAPERYNYRAEMHCCVGYELSKRNRLEEATVHLSEALRLRPDYGDAHKFLGIIRSQQRRHEEALGHFERALEQAPASYLIRYYMGVTLLNLGKKEEASHILNEALAAARASKEAQLIAQIEKLLQSPGIR